MKGMISTRMIQLLVTSVLDMFAIANGLVTVSECRQHKEELDRSLYTFLHMKSMCERFSLCK